MSPTEHCLLDTADSVLTITLNRPQVLNALHPAAHHELARVFDEFAADKSLRVAIVTGAGRAFCVGSDLKAIAAGGRQPRPAAGYAGLMLREDLFKPVIAAVNGLCLGGGLEFVLCCDMAVASESAEFGLPEPLVGLVADSGLPRLARQLPYKAAMKLALTSARIKADEAARCGLVNEVVAADQLLATARLWAQQIVAGAPLAIEATKQILQQNFREPDIFAATRASYPALALVHGSQDAKEGPQAFAAKRKPQWLGK